MPTEAGRFTGTAARKAACLGSSQRIREQVARIRESLFTEWRGMLASQERTLRLALNEAEAIAWQTEMPHLVFPALAEEKVRALARWNLRQQSFNAGRRWAFAA